MSITDKFLSKTKLINIYPEITKGNHGFSMHNDGGTEIEISELLYAFVRVYKPNYILETGTHKGISSSYMAQGLKDNRKGRITTLEIIQPHQQSAIALWKDLELTSFIETRLQESLKFTPVEKIDLLFLDSEPQLRFNEFVRFWPYVQDGALIIIHDLNHCMGHHGETLHGIYDWPYGDFRAHEIGRYIQDHSVQFMHFPNPRGLTIFQKTRSDSEALKFHLGE